MSKEKSILKVTIVGLLANVFLSAIKYTLGVVGHSSALIADAIHSLSDIVSDLAIMIGVKYWSAPADEDHPHGHERIEIFVSLFIGVMMFFVGVKLSYDGIINIKDGISTVPSKIALIAAGLSIVIKEILYRWTVFKGFELKSKSVIANGHHHRSDAISSIPVFIAILVASFYPRLSFVDNIGAIIVSFFIFQTSYSIIKESFDTLVDKAVPDEVLKQIRETALSFDHIRGVDNLKTRYIGSAAIDVEMDIEVDAEMTVREADTLVHEFEDDLKRKNSDIVDIAIHVNPFEG